MTSYTLTLKKPNRDKNGKNPMTKRSRVVLIGLALSVQLVNSGCVGGGGGFSGLFGAQAFADLIDSFGGSGGSSGGGSSSGSSIVTSSWDDDNYVGTDESYSESWDDSNDHTPPVLENQDGQGGTSGTVGQQIARVHNPEPASLALFGSGLAGVACLRRRKARNTLHCDSPVV